MATLLLALYLQGLAWAEPIVLQIGDDFLVKAPGTIRAPKNNLVSIQPLGGGALISGRKAGETEIKIGAKTWIIQVLNQKQFSTWRRLGDWTRSRLGLKTQVKQGQVFLTGRLLRAKDWLGLYRSCKDCEYKTELQVSAQIENEVQLFLSKVLKQKSLPEPSFRWNPEAQWLVPEKQKLNALFPVAEKLGIQVQSSEETLDIKPLIRTQIYIMEVRREKARQWGLDWPESISARLIPKPELILDQLTLSAHDLEQNGEGRVLANPTLLSRSGEEAEFLAGGEFPIKVISRNNAQVIWRKYGIQVRIKPSLDRFGKISMRLETEVSNIDAARSVDGVPGLLTHKVLSHFDLAKSRLIAISGLIKNDESQSLRGLPGLSQVPVLGALFSSREFRENRTELVILVKPEPVQFQALNGGSHD